MQRQVLLLNASEEILNVIDWKRAICLMLSGKALKPTAYSETYEIKTATGSLGLPKAIILSRYVYIARESYLPTRKNIFRRDLWTCQYCGMCLKNIKQLTIDHVMPKSKGGDSSWTNLTTACYHCNILKGNKILKYCNMKLLNKPKKPMDNTVRLELHYYLLLLFYFPHLKCMM